MAGDKLMDDTELRFLLVSGHAIGNAGSVCCPRNQHGSHPKMCQGNGSLVQFGRKPWNGWMVWFYFVMFLVSHWKSFPASCCFEDGCPAGGSYIWHGGEGTTHSTRLGGQATLLVGPAWIGRAWRLSNDITTCFFSGKQGAWVSMEGMNFHLQSW